MGHTTLEHYVNAALVMGLAAEQQGDRFGLITFSDRLHKFVRARTGKQHFTVCRDAIYRLQPRIVEPDFGELFSFLQTRLTKRALVVILTALDDPLIGETFARQVSIASRRHLTMAAMVRPEGARPLFEEELPATESAPMTFYEPISRAHGLAQALRTDAKTSSARACACTCSSRRRFRGS